MKDPNRWWVLSVLPLSYTRFPLSRFLQAPGTSDGFKCSVVRDPGTSLRVLVLLGGEVPSPVTLSHHPGRGPPLPRRQTGRAEGGGRRVSSALFPPLLLALFHFLLDRPSVRFDSRPLPEF